MINAGKWHGKKHYFGLHYDLHAGASDTCLGERCSLEELTKSLKLMKPEFVQTDCKGHPGMTSWFSKVPNATVSPGVKKDAMEGWRKATAKLGLPLHCHYSGIWDMAAGRKHPEWCVVDKDGKLAGGAFGDTAGKPTGEKMCPRGPYVDELLIPQFFELIDRYKVDGFWVDGEIWAVEPCYCGKCRAAFHGKTGIAEPPRETTDANWVHWINFTRESFEEYVTHYCNAVHQHKPGVLVCSNWMQTFKHPGEPTVPTDWVSGDALQGTDTLRCEARFISTRGKPWDIMTWAFFKNGGFNDPAAPWIAKPVEMLMQESSVVLAMGGNLMIYENPPGLRDGRLVPWRMKRLGEVGKFVKARRALCQDAQTIPQIAVLHSEHHLRRQSSTNLMWGYDTAPVEGAVFSLLEDSFGVDILDEWALLPRLAEFPVVVAPEQDNMSDAAVRALKDYVTNGGRLLVTGARACERFGPEFLGVESVEVRKDATFHVPGEEGAGPLFSKEWRLLKTTTAKPLGMLGKTPLLDDELLPHPAATVNKVGKGAVAYVPAEVFRFFQRTRYPLTRSFVVNVVEALEARFGIRVSAPICVDVVLRRKVGKRIVHLINRSSGIPSQPQNGAVDEVPVAGPVVVEFVAAKRPRKVAMALEELPIDWKYTAAKGQNAGGVVSAFVPFVHIHAALVVE